MTGAPDVLLAFALISAGINTMSGFSLKVTSNPQHLKPSPGDNVTLHCTVEGTGYSPFMHPIIWYKTVGGENIQMNTGVVTKKPWKRTGRYEISANMTEASVQLPLAINGIKLGDNGTYTCQLQGINGVLGSVEHTIMVPVPIDSLTLTTNISFSDNSTRDTFEFVELEPSFVRCKSVGGHPRPSLRILRGKTDISSEFKSHSQDRRQGKRGLEEVIYHEELVSRTFRVTQENNGETLKCIAKVPKLTHLRKSVTANMNVKYAPRFMCEEEKSVFPDVDNVTLECRINSNPSVDISTIVWIIGSTENNITVARSYDIYSTNATTEESTGDVLVHLFIANMTNTTFQVYHLFASNAVAQRHHDIVLTEAFTTMAPTTEEITTSPPSTKKPRVEIVIDAKPAKPVIASGSGSGASHTTYSYSLVNGLLALSLFSLFWISDR